MKKIALRVPNQSLPATKAILKSRRIRLVGGTMVKESQVAVLFYIQQFVAQLLNVFSQNSKLLIMTHAHGF